MDQQTTRIAPVAFSQGLYTQTRHQAQAAPEFRIVHGHTSLFLWPASRSRRIEGGIYTGVSVNSG